uniref:Uncharacterized protein n=1 Tax=Timema monikensis TaxID=170555 RepID=A0A7R9E6E1_9NEOP|nr:unnamed protein product [Timema monikensis]
MRAILLVPRRTELVTNHRLLCHCLVVLASGPLSWSSQSQRLLQFSDVSSVGRRTSGRFSPTLDSAAMNVGHRGPGDVDGSRDSQEPPFKMCNPEHALVATAENLIIENLYIRRRRRANSSENLLERLPREVDRVQVGAVVQQCFGETDRTGFGRTGQVKRDYDDSVQVRHITVSGRDLLQHVNASFNLGDRLPKHCHEIFIGHRGDPSAPSGRPALLPHHEAKQLGEREQRALSHRIEGFQDPLLHLQGVGPQRNAPVELACVGIHRTTVPDVVTGVWVCGSQDALADSKGLHPHFVRVCEEVFHLVMVSDFPYVVVEGPDHVPLLVHVGGPQQLQSIDPLGVRHKIMELDQILHDVCVTRHAGRQQGRHAYNSHQQDQILHDVVWVRSSDNIKKSVAMKEYRSLVLTVRVDIHLGPVKNEQFEYLETTTLRAVVERSVALDALPVDVCVQTQKELGDAVVTLVAGDHKTRVAMPVGHFDIWDITGPQTHESASQVNYRHATN